MCSFMVISEESVQCVSVQWFERWLCVSLLATKMCSIYSLRDDVISVSLDWELVCSMWLRLVCVSPLVQM